MLDILTQGSLLLLQMFFTDSCVSAQDVISADGAVQVRMSLHSLMCSAVNSLRTEIWTNSRNLDRLTQGFHCMEETSNQEGEDKDVQVCPNSKCDCSSSSAAN